MQLGSRGSRIRCLVVWTSRPARWRAGRRGPPVRCRARCRPGSLPRRPPLDVALTDLAAVALLGCAVWLWVVTTVVVVEALRGGVARRPAPRGIPAGVRRVVLAACGVALVGGLSPAAHGGRPHARPTHARTPRGPVRAPPPRPRGGRRGPAAPGPRPDATVLVRPGDSLWSLAARDLPAGQSRCARRRTLARDLRGQPLPHRSRPRRDRAGAAAPPPRKGPVMMLRQVSPVGRPTAPSSPSP